MTGFGLSSSISPGSEIYIEIKGVNHKFLEISVKPNDLNNEIEEFIRKSVTKNVIRGRVDIRIKLKTSYKTNFSIDSKLLKKLQNSLKDWDLDIKNPTKEEEEEILDFDEITTRLETSYNLSKSYISEIKNILK